MAVSRLKTWISGEVLSASDQNGEFNNILNNGEDLGWPATKAKDLDGQQLLLDADADSHFTADTDDRLDLALAGTDLFRWDGTVATPVNGIDFIARATGSPASIQAQGSDANVALDIRDDNGNELMVYSAVASAVNEITIENAIAAAAPEIQATGNDTNINIDLVPKGTGVVATGANVIAGSSTVTPDGTLHVHTGTAGAVTAAVNADDLVVERDASGGITVLTPAANVGRLGFGTVGDNFTGGLSYTHSDDSLLVDANNIINLSTASTNRVVIDVNGLITMPAQAAFLAFNSVTDTNVTGNGATATIDFDTEVTDKNSDFATDTFTAPVTGEYLLTTNVEIAELVSASEIEVRLVTSNRTYRRLIETPPDGETGVTLTVVADMDAADTVTVAVIVSGIAGDTADIVGNGSTLVTSFSGSLLN